MPLSAFSCCVAYCMIKSGAVKDLLREEGALEALWQRKLPFYLQAIKRDLLDIALKE